MEKITSFHTHTYRCKHATGTPADYIAQAEKDGCLALGFSDHCPLPGKGVPGWDNIRMAETEISDYISSVRDAGSSASFPVYCGFECEYDPQFESWYRDYLHAEMNTDYLVLGQHWGIVDGLHRYICNAIDLKDFHLYVDLTVKAIETGIFSFIAHPDLCLNRKDFSWTNPEVSAGLTDIIDCAIANNLPLEMNGNGYHLGTIIDCSGSLRNRYPVAEFWQLAKEKGARIICNSDAHSPADVIQFARNVRDYAASLGITPEENIFA